MKETMNQRFRIYRRHRGVYYLCDGLSGKRESLQTTDKSAPQRLLHARNEAVGEPMLNLEIARAYLAASDPQDAKRTWQHVMEEIPTLTTGNTRLRRLTASRDQALNPIHNLVLPETRAEHFLRVLENGSPSEIVVTTGL